MSIYQSQYTSPPSQVNTRMVIYPLECILLVQGLRERCLERNTDIRVLSFSQIHLSTSASICFSSAFNLESYEIYFVPNTCGNHWLNVSLNHIPMIENPCRLIVRPTSSSKGMSASGQGLFNAYTGEQGCDGRVVKALD